jgi:hypothetical protein
MHTPTKYHENADYPGLRLFRCEPLHADLTATSCARNFITATNFQCARCQIGAQHAQTSAPQAPAIGRSGFKVGRLEPQPPCVRCGARTLRRLVFKTLCVSCHNRERELLRGVNAKGGPPRRAASRLHRARCLLDRNGDAEIVDLPFCTGPREAAEVISRRWQGARLADYEVRPTEQPVSSPSAR